MLDKPISYKFIPALATMLCACAPAQAGINFHVGLNLPVCAPVVHPVCPVYSVSFSRAPRVRPASDMLIADIQQDLNGIHADLHSSCFSCDGERALTSFSRTVQHNWASWARDYRHAFGMSRYDLEALSDEVREVRFELSRLRNAHIHLCHYEFVQIRSLLMNVVDMITSHRLKSSDVRDLTISFSQIQRILYHC